MYTTEEIQRALAAASVGLNDASLDPQGIDGAWGPNTEAAMSSYERRIGSVAREYSIDHLMAAWGPSRGDGCLPGPPEPPEPSDVVMGAFLWQANKLSTDELLELCHYLHLGRVMPKVMNKHGRPMYVTTLQEHIPALHEAGIEVVPWAYLDDKGGYRDAEQLVEIVKGFGCDGAVANMEREIVDGKTAPQREHDAGEIDDVLAVLTEGLPGFVGFSSFRQRNYFPYPRHVFDKYADRVWFMNQCYNQKTPAQARVRTRSSTESWLEWDLKVRTTYGAFPVKASSSGEFGSEPAGIMAAGDELLKMANEYPKLDRGNDFWALEQVRVGYADQEQRDAVRTVSMNALGVSG
jgi:hypothetical protein